MFDLQEWSTVQRQCGCMGHEGLNRRILDLEVEDLHPEIVARAKQITQPLKHSVVRTVSAGSAAFHVWVSRCPTVGLCNFAFLGRS